MVFLWFSYGFPTVFLWFSYGYTTKKSQLTRPVSSTNIHQAIPQGTWVDSATWTISSTPLGRVHDLVTHGGCCMMHLLYVGLYMTLYEYIDS